MPGRNRRLVRVSHGSDFNVAGDIAHYKVLYSYVFV
jgi:hypothetical protein